MKGVSVGLLYRIEALEAAHEQLKIELRFLRRGQPRADADSCEALLEHIHDEFGPKPWTAARVFEAAADNPLLLGAVTRCLSGYPNIYKLAVLLTRCLDQPWGDYRLTCVQDHSREGRIFVVTGPVTRSHTKQDIRWTKPRQERARP